MTPMTGAMIALAIGFLLMFFDWRMATAPDEKDKLKRRKPLNPVERKKLRDMFMWTLGVAAGVWMAMKYFE